MPKITIYKTEANKTKERVIYGDIEYFDGYVKITSEGNTQVIKNFNNIIIE